MDKVRFGILGCGNIGTTDKLFYEELKKRIATSKLKDTAGDDLVTAQ